MNAITALLGAVQPAPLPHDYTELRLINRATGEIEQSWHRDPGPLGRHAIARASLGWDAYFGVHLRHGYRGGNSSVLRAGCIVADLDAKLFGDGSEALAAVETAATECPIPASTAVMSGGGFQLGWVFDVPLLLLDDAGKQRYRRLCQRMAQMAAGPGRAPDAIHDPARILRLPLTSNWKYAPPRPTELRWCDPSRRHRIEDLETWLDAHAPWTMVAHRPAPPTMAPRPEGLRVRVPDGLLRFARAGTPMGQRHHACFWLCCRLREAGVDDHDALAVLAEWVAACSPPADWNKALVRWHDSARYQGFCPGRHLPSPTPRYTGPLPSPRERSMP